MKYFKRVAGVTRRDEIRIDNIRQELFGLNQHVKKNWKIRIKVVWVPNSIEQGNTSKD